jgi:flagellar biosynthetic protein FliP
MLCLGIWISPAHAQDFFDGFSEVGLSERAIQIFLLLTILSIVPALAIMFTCFPFMVTVLAILRQGIGLQQSPPNILIISLALFLTFFVMEPVFESAWYDGIEPLANGNISLEVAVPNTMAPFRQFMLSRVDSETVFVISSVRPDFPTGSLDDLPLSILVPSFLLSEIEKAFQIGFLIFLPFLIIDLVVAAILMSMGMMMVPPVIVSLPFKLAFFVVADGWSLVSGALVRSYF